MELKNGGGLKAKTRSRLGTCRSLFYLKNIYSSISLATRGLQNVDAILKDLFLNFCLVNHLIATLVTT